MSNFFLNKIKELNLALKLVERKYKRSEEGRVMFEDLKDKSDKLYEIVLNDLQKKEIELEETIVELKKQKSEKEVLIKEIHHTIKNNLQVVNTLLNFQAREFNNPIIKSKFDATRNRIISIAKLHEQMYSSTDLIHINLKKHFQELTIGLISTYSVGKNIKLIIDIDSEIKFGMKTIVPLGLLINEVVTNSCKYGFPNLTNGEFKLFIQREKEESYVLTIGDNGVGYDEQNITKSLGSQLIEVFTRQLEGEIQKINCSGTVYQLIFKSID